MLGRREVAGTVHLRHNTFIILPRRSLLRPRTCTGYVLTRDGSNPCHIIHHLKSLAGDRIVRVGKHNLGMTNKIHERIR